MKKKLYALSGVFLIVLVLAGLRAGLRATKAIDLTDVQQAVDPAATSMHGALSLRDMTEGATMIVMGTCLETRSQWVGRSLVTLATVSVEETLKGGAAVGTAVTVELPGGIDANRRFKVAMTYAGAPQISRDEKVLLFLTGPDDGANSYSVMGLSQGKYSVGKDTAGQPVVTRDMTMAPMQKGAGMIRGNPHVVPLSEFKELVNSYLHR